MEAENSFITQIRDELRQDRLVPVIGAGVSLGAAGLPNWLTAVRQALQHLRHTEAADPGALNEAERLLGAGQLIPAASLVVDQLKDLREWAAWLRLTFRIEQEQVTDWATLRAIFELMSPMIATTNYDRILSFNPLQATQVASWDQPAAMEAALKDGRSVLHLHGIWDRPQSVVFGSEDYDRLVGTDAYRSVLRTLWLDRTLLFIGCSFDGMQDPDFSRHLEWAYREFGQSPFRHYALLEAGSYDQAQARFLLQHRIQAVKYGPGHAQLPEVIRELNPHREQALTASANRIRELVQGQDPKNTPPLRQLLEQLLPATQTTVNVPAAANDLLQRRSATSDRLRQELFRLQNIAEALIDRDLLRLLIDRVDPDKQIAEDEKESTRTAVLMAGRAFRLFPDPLIAALRQRGVYIHVAVLDGYAGKFMSVLSKSAEIDRHIAGKWGLVDPLDHAYSRENMQRTLNALEAILDVDPLVIFPASAAGLGAVPEGSSIVVARWDRIEIRPLDRPNTRSSVLSVGSPGLIGLHSVRIDGEPLLVGFTSSAVLAWNPRSSLDPVSSYEVGGPRGIDSVAHLAAPDGLHTYVLTEHTVDHLVDFSLRDRIALPGYHNLTDITVHPGHLLLCRDAGSDSILRIDSQADPVTMLDGESLLGELKRRRAVAGNESVTIAQSGVARSGRRTFAAMHVLIDRNEPGGYQYESGALLCDVDINYLRPISFFRVPEENLFSTQLQDLGDGGFRVMCGTKPFGTSAQPMVFWSCPHSAADFSLAIAGSAVEAEAEWAAVGWLNGNTALAGTGGILWSVDVQSGKSAIIDQDNGTSIHSIDLVDW